MQIIDNNIVIIILTALLLLTVISKYLYSKFRVKYSHKWRRKSALKVLEKIKNMNDAQIFGYLRKVDAFTMEELILSALEKREDIKVERNKKYTGDGGIDGRFFHYANIDGKKVRRKYIIQVKRYSSYINRKHLLLFANQTVQEKAHFGLFIHTGKTGQETMKISKDLDNIEIISGAKLIQLVKYSNIKL